MHKSYLFFFFAFLIFCHYCSNEKSVNQTNKFKIEPETGFIGSMINISGVETNLHPSLYQIKFNGAENMYVDSVVNGKVYSHVPFGATTGKVEVNINNHTEIFESFVVLEQSPDTVLVKWYNLSIELFEYDSWFKDFSGILRTWQGAQSGDTLEINTSGLCGDECNYRMELKLKNNPSKDLPEFVSLVWISSDHFDGTEIDTLKSGIIKIQDYDIEGVVSGRIYCRCWEPTSVVFWVDFNNQ